MKFFCLILACSTVYADDWAYVNKRPDVVTRYTFRDDGTEGIKLVFWLYAKDFGGEFPDIIYCQPVSNVRHWHIAWSFVRGGQLTWLNETTTFCIEFYDYKQVDNEWVKFRTHPKAKKIRVSVLLKPSKFRTLDKYKQDDYGCRMFKKIPNNPISRTIWLHDIGENQFNISAKEYKPS